MAELGSRIGVGILTTQSVVMVQRIEPETASSKSVMCINRTSIETGVSRAYNAFVRPGTGVVSRMTGAAAFRVDVTDDVTEGSSWQLGIFLAHALRKDDRLAMLSDDAQPVEVWLATGAVNSDHEVTPIEDLERKLTVLGGWLAANASSLIKVRVLIPAENINAAIQSSLDALTSDYPVLSVERVVSADQSARVPEKARAGFGYLRDWRLLAAGGTIAGVALAAVLLAPVVLGDQVSASEPAPPTDTAPPALPIEGDPEPDEVPVSAARPAEPQLPDENPVQNTAASAQALGDDQTDNPPPPAEQAADAAPIKDDPDEPVDAAKLGPSDPPSDADVAEPPSPTEEVPPAAPTPQADIRLIVQSTESNCFAERSSNTVRQAQHGDTIELPASTQWCRMDIEASSASGAALSAYLVERNGNRTTPQYLGGRGSLLPVIADDTTRLEVAFSNGEAPDTINAWPSVVISLDGAQTGP